jgi:hypothetical protein
MGEDETIGGDEAVPDEGFTSTPSSIFDIQSEVNAWSSSRASLIWLKCQGEGGEYEEP